MGLLNRCYRRFASMSHTNVCVSYKCQIKHTCKHMPMHAGIHLTLQTHADTYIHLPHDRGPKWEVLASIPFCSESIEAVSTCSPSFPASRHARLESHTPTSRVDLTPCVLASFCFFSSLCLFPCKVAAHWTSEALKNAKKRLCVFMRAEGVG
jgi:hypothetical protein